MNEQFAETVEQGAKSQRLLTEAWLSSVERATQQETLDEAAESLLGAYEVWMRAAHETSEMVNDALEGEDIPAEQFRDTWLNAANLAFKEVMSTTMFSAATGQSIEDLLGFRRRTDEVAEAFLHELGLPSQGDIEEVGTRLVELERRQHELTERIEEALSAVESD